LVKKLEPTTQRKELAKIAGTSEGSIQRTRKILDKGVSMISFPQEVGEMNHWGTTGSMTLNLE
jgi:hypothetical protein